MSRQHWGGATVAACSIGRLHKRQLLSDVRRLVYEWGMRYLCILPLSPNLPAAQKCFDELIHHTSPLFFSVRVERKTPFRLGRQRRAHVHLGCEMATVVMYVENKPLFEEEIVEESRGVTSVAVAAA